jgi:hypothetical protein
VKEFRLPSANSATIQVPSLNALILFLMYTSRLSSNWSASGAASFAQNDHDSLLHIRCFEDLKSPAIHHSGSPRS